MGTVKQFITTAYSDLGYKESPYGSNKTKFGEWIGLQGQPWCMSAIQYWAYKAGVQLPARTGSCTVLKDAATKAGQWVTSGYKQGDIIIYQWKNGMRHCGVLFETLGNTIKTIEGNTGIGNDSNGGEVMLRKRTLEFVLGAVRPKFTEEVNTMDYQQFLAFLASYRQELRDNDSSAYSEAARNWATSIGLILGNGVTSDGQPNYMWQDFITREQVVTLLYRYDLWLRQNGR